MMTTVHSNGSMASTVHTHTDTRSPLHKWHVPSYSKLFFPHAFSFTLVRSSSSSADENFNTHIWYDYIRRKAEEKKTIETREKIVACDNLAYVFVDVVMFMCRIRIREVHIIYIVTQSQSWKSNIQKYMLMMIQLMWRIVIVTIFFCTGHFTYFERKKFMCFKLKWSIVQDETGRDWTCSHIYHAPYKIHFNCN